MEQRSKNHRKTIKNFAMVYGHVLMLEVESDGLVNFGETMLFSLAEMGAQLVAYLVIWARPCTMSKHALRSS